MEILIKWYICIENFIKASLNNLICLGFIALAFITGWSSFYMDTIKSKIMFWIICISLIIGFNAAVCIIYGG